MNDESEFAVPYQERLQGFANYPLLRSSEVLFRCFDVEIGPYPCIYTARNVASFSADICQSVI